MQGKLIVFEGGDGAGKTTQLKQVQEWLEHSPLLPLGCAIAVTREPGGTTLGKYLRQALLGTEELAREPLHERTELLLYAADRAHHVETMLKPELARGTIILCDRYTDSTIAYQGYGRRLDRRLIDQLNLIATGGLQPDLTLWLDVDATTGAARTKQRGVADRMEQADLDFHQRVRQGFRELHEREPQRVVRIDGEQDEASVAHQIQAVLEQRFRQWYPTPSHP